MTIEIWAIGGYSEIGKNMTGIRVDDEVFILDMGYDMDKVVSYEGTDISALPYDKMFRMGAIPDDTKFRKEWGSKVKAIICGHAHLDHIGAIPLIAPRYKCPVFVTPFTAEVIKNQLGKKRLKNKIIRLNPSSSYKLTKNVKLEFINVTHSTLQTVIAVLHTKYGAVAYAGDWKFDDYPILGKRTNYKRLKEIGKKKVLVQISDTTRIEEEGHTPSEHIVREMMRDVLTRYDTKGNAIIVTTFSSHIARISTIISIAKQIKRKAVLLGRSLANYVTAAEMAGLFSTNAEVIGFKDKMRKKLGDIEKNRDKYLIICTGNQGEPDAVLSLISKKQFPFRIKEDDIIIFSCKTIPTPVNEANREILEKRLRSDKARIFKEIHASGHAAKEDQKELLKMLKPMHFIPTHGGMDKLAKAADMAMEVGYKFNKTVHILQDGSRIILAE